jgi:hypothetical protein
LGLRGGADARGLRVDEGDLLTVAARDLQCNPDEIETSDPTKEQSALLRVSGAPTQGYARLR